MRAGMLALGLGIALYAVGVVSTRMDAWSAKPGEQSSPLQIEGVDTVDLRGSGINEIDIGKGQAAALEVRRFRQSRNGQEFEAPTCKVTDRVLRCAVSPDASGIGGKLTLPPSVSTLLLDGYVGIHSKGGIDRLSIQTGGHLTWTGDAAHLEIRRGDRPASQEEDRGAMINFESGKVRELHLKVSDCNVSLGDLSGVDSVKLDAGSRVGLSLGNLDDLGRIRIARQGGDAAPGPQVVRVTPQ